MNIKHHSNLSHEEFIRCYQESCHTALEHVLMNRLISIDDPITTGTQQELDDALSTLEDIADLARGF